MNPKLNLIKIEAVINPLELNNARLCLNEIGIKNPKFSEIVEISDKENCDFISNERKFPFKLTSKTRIEITACEMELEQIVSALNRSLISVNIKISKFMEPFKYKLHKMRSHKLSSKKYLRFNN